MAYPPLRRQSLPPGKPVSVAERAALIGSDGYPAEGNRFITERDTSRQLDAILTDNNFDVLVDPNGDVLFG